MKRMITILLALSLLLGCERRTIEHRSTDTGSSLTQTATAAPSAVPSAEPATPAPTPTATPQAALPTFAPTAGQKAFFTEELLSLDAEPIASKVAFLLGAQDLSKADFYACFNDIIDQTNDLDRALLDLAQSGRTLTADRKDRTADALAQLMDRQMQEALQNAYAGCPGEDDDLPLALYAASLGALLQDVQKMEERTATFFELGADVAAAYKTVLERYMGETIMPRSVFYALEELAQTEAYAIQTALQADPEAARKKEPISFGSFGQNMAFLCKVTEELCPPPHGESLRIPVSGEGRADMDLLELAFWQYPGMAYLNVYAAMEDEEQQKRWANAPDGYLAGLAVHNSYAIIPYLSDFGLDYMQYRWYEDMLDVTLTGISALLIHYYGYSEKDLTTYLQGWGAENFASYLYEKAMSDPFESLIASYGYCQYLDICQAALDAGCENERRFLQDYLAAGPAPFDALKEYMLSLYGKQG